jgi:hypothetical protein
VIINRVNQIGFGIDPLKGLWPGIALQQNAVIAQNVGKTGIGCQIIRAVK